MTLFGKIVLVTGASKGVGKGIAEEFCEAGATVIITSRPDETRNSVFSNESLEEYAERISSIYAGKCVAIRCDHSKNEDVVGLFKTIENGYNNIDILVNNVFASSFTCAKIANKRFYELQNITGMFEEFLNVGLKSHLLCSSLAAQLMIKNKTRGLIVTVSSEGGGRFLFNTFYGVQKAACDRMAADMAYDLKKEGITSVSFWPGAVATELYHNLLGKSDDPFLADLYTDVEHPRFVGKCVVSLATDPDILAKTGQILTSTRIAHEYGLKNQTGNTVSRRQHLECDEYLKATNTLRCD
ncbi:unnamed protein product [Bursaphelenchus okinawaensis]|uniref:Uncharacterized protein n=1 Tax=Bursaphelenchus okinawaensis TaxID=465554 RepID=A0A811KTU1_9BILA|nr:unnamed protein product [Bursaphelenchus okinawaensis]CAG9112010.1 unnamed protein product [Bursaphelenchus okinawaensis]